jgi:hypothetical protein
MNETKNYKLNRNLKSWLFAALFIAIGFLLPSCLPSSNQKLVVNSSISSSEFSGVFKVTNLNGPLKIEWLPALITVKEYKIYHQNSEGDFELIGTTDATKSEFIHGTTGNILVGFTGKIHTYKVTAVDANGIEANNETYKSAISYTGIVSAVSTGKSTLSVTLSNVTASFDEVHIYGRTTTLGDGEQLLATVPADQIQISLVGLKSGITYILRAQAYSTFLDKEDGNTITTTGQTSSYTADGYLGVYNVQAYGPAPDAPMFQPREKQVLLSWLNFSNGLSSSKYRVIRVPRDVFINSNPKNASGLVICTDTTDTACIVEGCEAVSQETSGQSLGPYCLDKNVAASPMVYDYAIIMLGGSGASAYGEELELGKQDLHRIRVHIPPKNMALVQRDAVNFEMCQLIRQIPKPFEHQKCIFNGFGSVPLNAGPGRHPFEYSPDHYDFGYNLFVDRWELGCNYDMPLIGDNTTAVLDLAHNDTNVNNAAYAGKVVLSTYASSISSIGSGVCRLNKANSSGTRYWYGTSGYDPYASVAGYTKLKSFESLQSSDLASITHMFTNNPTTDGTDASGNHYKTVAVNFGLNQAWTACQSQIDPVYGAKRLPRMREFRAYAAFSWLPGEKIYDSSTNTLLKATMTSNELLKRQSPTNAAETNYLSGYYNGIDPQHRSCMTFTNSTTSNGDISFPTNYTNLKADLVNRTSNVFWPRLSSSPTYIMGYTGSNVTSGCVSRFGIQDAIGGQDEYVSDRMGECNARPINRATSINDNCKSTGCQYLTLDFLIDSASNAKTCTFNLPDGTTAFPGGVGNCPSYTSKLPDNYIKFCTASGGGLDSGNIDLNPTTINPGLGAYSIRIQSTTTRPVTVDSDYYYIKDNWFSNVFNPVIGMPEYTTRMDYTYDETVGQPGSYSKSFSQTTGQYVQNSDLQIAVPPGFPDLKTKILRDKERVILEARGKAGYIEYNDSRNGYARRILVGGRSDDSVYAGRWHTRIIFQGNPENYYTGGNDGARCVLPAALPGE